jgi:hypothetical protein
MCDFWFGAKLRSHRANGQCFELAGKQAAGLHRNAAHPANNRGTATPMANVQIKRA